MWVCMLGLELDMIESQLRQNVWELNRSHSLCAIKYIDVSFSFSYHFVIFFKPASSAYFGWSQNSCHRNRSRSKRGMTLWHVAQALADKSPWAFARTFQTYEGIIKDIPQTIWLGVGNLKMNWLRPQTLNVQVHAVRFGSAGRWTWTRPRGLVQPNPKHRTWTQGAVQVQVQVHGVLNHTDGQSKCWEQSIQTVTGRRVHSIGETDM